MLPIQVLRMRNAGGGVPFNPLALSIYTKIVDWWEGNETSGTSAIGLHAGLDGTYVNMVLNQPPIAAGLDVCVESTADGRVSVPYDSALTLTGNFAVMSWINRGACTDLTPALVWKSTGDDASYLVNYALYLYSVGGYVPVFLVTTAANAAVQVIGTTGTTIGVPYLIIGNRIGSNLELFMNSVSEGTVGGSTSCRTGTQGLYSGRTEGFVSQYRYVGYLGSRAVFSDALTSDERTYLWNGGNGITYAALKAAAGF